MDYLVLTSLCVITAYLVYKSIYFKKDPNELKSDTWKSFSWGTETYLPPTVAALSIFASLNGGFMVFGLVQVGYQGGLSGYVWSLAYLTGLPIIFWVLKRLAKNSRMRKGLFGIDVMLFEHYGPKSMLAFYLLSGIAFAGVLGGQFLSIGYFLKSIDRFWFLIALFIVGVLGTVCYTIWHGFKGVIFNDVLQSILEFIVSIIFPGSILYFLWQKGNVNFNLVSETIGGDYGTFYPIFGAIFLCLSFPSRADLWQRLARVKNEHYMRVILITTILLVFYYFAMTSAGILLKQNKEIFEISNDMVSHPGGLSMALYKKLFSVQPDVFNCVGQVLFLTGVLTAILSSVDSYLNLTSLSLTKFALWRVIPKANEAELTQHEQDVMTVNARIATIAVAVLAGIFATLLPDLIDLMSASFSVIGVLIPIVVVGLFSKRKHRDVTGALPLWISLILLIILLPVLRKFAFIPAISVGLLLFFLMLWIENRKAPQEQPSGTLEEEQISK